MATSLPISKPYFGEEELAAIQEPILDGWVVQGPRVAEFERRFAEFTGAANAVASTSCTTSLHLAVVALGLAPGDEVIVPAFSWVSTANVVEYQGAKPVFCDIDPRTFNIDPLGIEALVTEKTVGIIPVHLFGLAAPMKEVREIADRHSLWVVEDAACGFGTRVDGDHVGTLGDVGCFSFHPRKSISTGEGGMLTTDDDALADLARTMRDQGASRSDLARHGSSGGFQLAEFDVLGFNYRMTDLQGALGCIQVDRADFILTERSRLAKRYEEELSGNPWLELPSTPPGENHGWQSYVTSVVSPDLMTSDLDSMHAQRNKLMLALENEGIATRQGTLALVNIGVYRSRYQLEPRDFPGAQRAAMLSMAIPLFPGMTEADQDRVVDAIRRHTSG